MDNNSEKDRLAKSAARGPRATQPGAVSVSGDAASRLDERIAEKRREFAPSETETPKQLSNLERDVASKHAAARSGGAAVKPGVEYVPAPSSSDGQAQLESLESDITSKQRAARPQTTGTSQPGAFAELNSLESQVVAKQAADSESQPSGEKSLTALESDIASKQRARPAQVISKPGAYHETSNGPAAKTELNSLENDIVAKQQARPAVAGDAPSKPGAYSESSAPSELSSLERNIQAKSRPSPVVSSAETDLTNMEDAVMAKMRRDGGSAVPTPASSSDDPANKKTRSQGSAPPPGAHAELTSLEDSVVAKTRGEPRHTMPGARAELNALEDSVTAKTNPVTRERQQNEISRLDDRIAAKTAMENGSSQVSNCMDGKLGLAAMPSKDAASDLEHVVGDSSAKKHDETPEQAPTKDGELEASNGGLVSQIDVENGVDSEGLAVAFEVEEEEDDAYIPAAVEYDPDAKPAIYKSHRYRLYSILASFVLILAIVGAVLGITLSKDDGEIGPTEPTAAPTMAPTSYRQSFGIDETIEQLVGSEVLDDAESPYAKALDWILHKDPMELAEDDEDLVQRYTAAFFYFATSVEKPWRSCNPPAANETDVCIFDRLSDFGHDEYDRIQSTRWLTNMTVCSWAGVKCDKLGQVRALELNGHEMTGTFPEGVHLFPFLQSISLSFNELGGPLPVDIGKMKHLNNIELHFNQFTGEIPLEFWQSRNLIRINLAHNSISGSIPPEIGDLESLKGLFLYENNMVGSIPEELGTLEDLSHIDLSNNAIQGTIPANIFTRSNLQFFYARRNELSGTLPDTIGTYTTLRSFRLGGNPLSGELPSGLFTLPDLSWLDLFDCNFSGQLSPAVGQLNLSILRISGNNFSGPIPAELANMTLVDEVWLHDNNFEGPMPAAICDLRDPNLLEELTADCLEDDMGIAEVPCPEGCCTRCCDKTGQQCVELNV